MNLWPVEHFFPCFFSRSALISTDLEKKWGQKCSTGQRFICTEVTSYKIHTLIPSEIQPPLKSSFLLVWLPADLIFYIAKRALIISFILFRMVLKKSMTSIYACLQKI